MRFVRFLLKELVLRGVLFTVFGTAALVALYLSSIGAPPEDYAKAARTFLLFISGSPEFSASQVGFSAQAIIASGAAITFPLALGALFFMTMIALVSASASAASRYLAGEQGRKLGSAFGGAMSIVASLLSATPLFVGFWLLYGLFGMNPPMIFIALIAVLVGGAGWDASRFLIMDMHRQIDSTHTMVYSMLGPSVGRLFPMPGTMSGYLLNSCAPRFIPYIAGKVPAIIGGITIAEMVFSFPGLGRTLLESLLLRNDEQLIASVFVLLTVNAFVTFLVKTVLFVMYPRWYEKAI
jgi:ABC-type dipeptide/oligopeptide/nickel transport system permease component